MEVGAINFGGLASGIDTRALIDAIIQAERLPIKRLESRQALLNRKDDALDEMSSRLDALLGTLRDLSTDRTFRGRVATLSDETFFRASAGPGAELGLFSVEVLERADAHKVMSVGVAESDQALVSDGTITIQSGGNDPITVDVNASTGTNTLRSVRDAINDADGGVQASILYDGSEYRLIVRAEETGVANALAITDTTNLGLDDVSNEVTAAADARITVDGIEITSSDNSISGVIEGVTFDLLATTEGSAVTLAVEQDTETAIEAVQSLVDSYNEAIRFFNVQFDLNNPGPLARDGYARRLSLTMQTLVTGGLDGVPFGGIRSLSSIGVSFDGRSGEMSLDTAKLTELLDERFEEVGNLFLTSADTSDPRIQYVSTSSATVPGEYDVEITSVAEQATLVGSAPIRPEGLQRDETLTIEVGAQQTTVDLTADMVIDDVVDAVNAALTSAGLGATATNDGGALRVTTDDYGSDQTLTITSSRNSSQGRQTGFSRNPISDTGEDLAGRIGGVDATASGQFLTGAEGEPFEGLTIRVTATAADVAATGGDFGTVSFSPGLPQKLIGALSEATRVGDGQIENLKETVDDQLRRIADEITRIEERLVSREARLIRTFSAAEQAISLLQAQQSQLGSFFPF